MINIVSDLTSTPLLVAGSGVFRYKGDTLCLANMR